MRNKLTVGFDDLGNQPVKNISLPVQAFRVRLDGAAQDSRKPASRPRADPARDQPWRSRRLRRRAIQAALLIALLCVINLVTSPGYLWFLWAALYSSRISPGMRSTRTTPNLMGADDSDCRRSGATPAPHPAERHMRRLQEDRNQHYRQLDCPCWADRKAMALLKEQPRGRRAGGQILHRLSPLCP